MTAARAEALTAGRTQAGPRAQSKACPGTYHRGVPRGMPRVYLEACSEAHPMVDPGGAPRGACPSAPWARPEACPRVYLEACSEAHPEVHRMAYPNAAY